MHNGYGDIPSILLTPIAVDKDKVDDVLVKTGYLKREDIYQEQ